MTVETTSQQQPFSSVSIEKNSRGYTWGVKVYFAPGCEAEGLETLAGLEAALAKEYGQTPDPELKVKE